MLFFVRPINFDIAYIFAISQYSIALFICMGLFLVGTEAVSFKHLKRAVKQKWAARFNELLDASVPPWVSLYIFTT